MLPISQAVFRLFLPYFPLFAFVQTAQPTIIPVPAKIIRKHKIWPVEMFKSEVFWLIDADGSLAILKPKSLSGILKYSKKKRKKP